MFSLAYLFCNMLMSSNKLSALLGFQFSMMTYFKLVIAFCVMFVVTSYCKSELEFISKFSTYGAIIITIAYTFDYYITQISGTIFLFRVWWLGAIIMSHFGILVGVLTSCKKQEFEKFFNRFAIGIAAIYLITFIICFIRNPFSGRTTNFTLFKGTFYLLPKFLNNPFGDFEAPLIFFGNIFVFVPAPIIIKGIAKKLSQKQLMIIGFILPIFVEGYQYILQCGDVDVDDLILNWFGYGIGLLLIRLTEKRLTKKATSIHNNIG